jgi:hypothetical protein
MTELEKNNTWQIVIEQLNWKQKKNFYKKAKNEYKQ